MRYRKDTSGRFRRIPYYDAHEIEDRCTRLIYPCIQQRRTAITFPITVDDLSVLIEEHVADLDLYADLNRYGENVEGVTLFQIDQQPKVAIASRLSAISHLRRRLKTTLAHELGHVILHTDLFTSSSLTRQGAAWALYSASQGEDEKDDDWMEWQAWQAAASFLLPAEHISITTDQYLSYHGRRSRADLRYGYIPGLIATIVKTFDVSPAFAQRRLQALKIISR